MNKKYRWGIVADIIRELSNPSNSGINMSDTEIEVALQDLANIMDTMMVNNCNFSKAVKSERENNEDFGEWIEKTISVIN